MAAAVLIIAQPGVNTEDFEIITETTVRRQISTRIHDQQRSAPSLVTTGQTDPTPSDSQSSFELGDFVLPSKESTGEYYFYTGSTQAQLKRFFEFSLTESELFGKNKFDIAKKYIPLDFDEMLLQDQVATIQTSFVTLLIDIDNPTPELSCKQQVIVICWYLEVITSMQKTDLPKDLTEHFNYLYMRVSDLLIKRVLQNM